MKLNFITIKDVIFVGLSNETNRIKINKNEGYDLIRVANQLTGILNKIMDRIIEMYEFEFSSIPLLNTIKDEILDKSQIHIELDKNKSSVKILYSDYQTTDKVISTIEKDDFLLHQTYIDICNKVSEAIENTCISLNHDLTIKETEIM